MHGIDFGGYTEWRRPDTSPLPIDFVICGVAWGATENTYIQSNMPEIQKEKRLMTYGFYHGEPDWKTQAILWLKLSVEAKSKAIWLDWERSSNSVLSINPRNHARRAENILKYLSDNFPGKVGIYSNFNDYIDYLQPYVDVREYPWWAAWPLDDYNSPVGTDYWWGRINRDNYTIYQYTWKGYAKDYGVINNKKSIDLDIVNPKVNLDSWLGNAPEPSPVNGDYNDALDYALMKIDTLRYEIEGAKK